MILKNISNDCKNSDLIFQNELLKLSNDINTIFSNSNDVIKKKLILLNKLLYLIIILKPE
jgi:hypothetical protein